MRNQGREYIDQSQTQRQRIYREPYMMHVHSVILSGVVVAVVCIGFGFLLWIAGTPGKIFDCVVLVLLLAAGIFRMTVWVIYHTHRIEKSYVNRRVIETQHVSVYAHEDGSFTNFTAEVAAAALPEPKDEPMDAEPYPHDTWEQQIDRSIYNAKTLDNMTWPEVSAKFHRHESWCKRAKDRHEGRITRGETFDGRL